MNVLMLVGIVVLVALVAGIAYLLWPAKSLDLVDEIKDMVKDEANNVGKILNSTVVTETKTNVPAERTDMGTVAADDDAVDKALATAYDGVSTKTGNARAPPSEKTVKLMGVDVLKSVADEYAAKLRSGVLNTPKARFMALPENVRDALMAKKNARDARQKKNESEGAVDRTPTEREIKLSSYLQALGDDGVEYGLDEDTASEYGPNIGALDKDITDPIDRQMEAIFKDVYDKAQTPEESKYMDLMGMLTTDYGSLSEQLDMQSDIKTFTTKQLSPEEARKRANPVVLMNMNVRGKNRLDFGEETIRKITGQKMIPEGVTRPSLGDDCLSNIPEEALMIQYDE